MTDTTALAIVDPRALVALGPRLTEEFTYEGETGQYVVYSIDGEPLTVTDEFRLTVAKNPSGQLGVMMVAGTKETNEAVDRQIRILNTLQTIATDIDAEVQAEADAAGTKAKLPYYSALFPASLETLETPDGRLAVFMGYHPVIDSYRQFVPMSVLLTDHRVDVKTGAWIMGKLLKMLNYLHDQGFTLEFVDASNVFLEIDRHGVFALDFTNANEDATEADKLAEVAEAAKLVWWAVGGGEAGELPPYDADLGITEAQHAEIIGFFQNLMAGKLTAQQGHIYAYTDDSGLFDRLWPRQVGGYDNTLKRDFHPWRVIAR